MAANPKEVDKTAPFVQEMAPRTQDSSLRLGFQADPVKARTSRHRPDKQHPADKQLGGF
jgi:hypothetical protein